jgi:hypothetical protein
MQQLDVITVCVDGDANGTWRVWIPGTPDVARCADLGEARRLASTWAADHRPSERIVRDAYHRVLEDELLERD